MWAAPGVIGSTMRTSPYVPILSSTPASSTEPTVGAAVWASGSQLCSGHMGALTASPTMMARAAISWVVWLSSEPPAPEALSDAVVASATMSKVPPPSPTRRRPSSMTTEPSSV
ncbi:hypothetical protein SANTM175S_11062 [Streptomyces antimycoticus]